jgi:ProP effector
MGPAACAAALAERFPALFAAQPPLPIKLRIQADIQERAPGVFTRKALSIFLHRHTTSTPYIRALVAAQTRFDLDGQPAGEIAAEHREAAVAELERRKAIVQAKRQAERAAMRPPQGERPPRPPRAQQPPGAVGEARPDRPPRFQRPRPAQPPQQARPPRPDRERAPAEQRRPPPQQREAEPALPVVPPGPDAEARRSRALLLRAYETSTISRANFCALKGLTDAALEAQLQQARAERGEHAAPRAADQRQRR